MDTCSSQKTILRNAYIYCNYNILKFYLVWYKLKIDVFFLTRLHFPHQRTRFCFLFCCFVFWTLKCDVHPHRQIYHHPELCESKCRSVTATNPSSSELWRSLYGGPPVLSNPPVRLWLPVCVSGTLQWIKLAAVGHHLGLGYSFCCSLRPLLHIYIFFLTFLNDYAPARTYLIPGVRSEEAKKFSLYISGWCLQKSSDGIWQVVLPTLSLSQFHSEESSTAFLLQQCQLKTVQVKSHTRTTALFTIAPNHKKSLGESARAFVFLCQAKSCNSAETLTVFKARLNLKCLSHECSYANKISGSTAK